MGCYFIETKHFLCLSLAFIFGPFFLPSPLSDLVCVFVYVHVLNSSQLSKHFFFNWLYKYLNGCITCNMYYFCCYIYWIECRISCLEFSRSLVKKKSRKNSFFYLKWVPNFSPCWSEPSSEKIPHLWRDW